MSAKIIARHVAMTARLITIFLMEIRSVSNPSKLPLRWYFKTIKGEDVSFCPNFRDSIYDKEAYPRICVHYKHCIIQVSC